MPLARSRSFVCTVALTLLATATGPLLAQEEDEADHQADHQALREIRAAVEEAINNNQLDLFRPHLAESFSIVTYTDREFSDFEAFKTRWQKTREELLEGGTYTTQMNPERSLILGDIAIARGNSHNVLTTGGGERFEFPSRWTAVLQKQDGGWKVLRAHSSLSPFANPMIVSAVKWKLLYVAVASAAAGLVVGAAGMWLIGRRRDRMTNDKSQTT